GSDRPQSVLRPRSARIRQETDARGRRAALAGGRHARALPPLPGGLRRRGVRRGAERDGPASEVLPAVRPRPCPRLPRGKSVIAAAVVLALPSFAPPDQRGQSFGAPAAA